MVSLLASGTEWVHALGFGRFQVGRSHECDEPATVRALPCLTAPRIDVQGSSAEIDRAVKKESEHRASLYEVDAEALSALRPTHVVTQMHCEVCAVSDRDVLRALSGVERAEGDPGPTIVSLRPDTLADVYRDAVSMGEALGDRPAGERAVAAVRSRMEAVRETASRSERSPRVAMVEWIEPVMLSGNWMPEMVRTVNAVPVHGDDGKHSPEIPFEALAASDPDVVVVVPCGFDLTRTRKEMSAPGVRGRFASLRAFREGRTFLADGNRYFNRPGPSLADALEILAEIVHPEVFPSLHRGQAWERLT